MLQNGKLGRVLLAPIRPLPQVVTLTQEPQHVLVDNPGLLEAGSNAHNLPPRTGQRPIRINHSRRNTSHQTRLAVTPRNRQRTITRPGPHPTNKPSLPRPNLHPLAVQITTRQNQAAQPVDQIRRTHKWLHRHPADAVTLCPRKRGVPSWGLGCLLGGWLVVVGGGASGGDRG